MHGRRLTDYAFTLVCERKDGVIYCDEGLFRARVERYNVDMDYALLASVDKKDLTPIPLSIRPVEADRDLKVFHMPIDDFNDVEADDSLSVHTKWVKSTFPTAHHMKCSGGLYAGSSGAPFVMRDGRAVGFYCESISREAEMNVSGLPTDEAIEILSETVNSRAINHGSFCRALLTRSCKKLVEVLKEYGVLLYE
jgi:hypothetical protein